MSLCKPELKEPVEFVCRGPAGGVGGDANPATVVRFAGHSGGEFLGSVAGEDEVRVGIDEAWKHACSISVDVPVGRGPGGSDRLDEAVGDDDACVLQLTERPRTKAWVVGDQKADVVDDE